MAPEPSEEGSSKYGSDAPPPSDGGRASAPVDGGPDGSESRPGEPPSPAPVALVVATVLLAVAAGVLVAVGLAHWGRAESRGSPSRSGAGAFADPAKGDAPREGRSSEQPPPRCLDGHPRPKRFWDRPAVAVKVENSPAARPQSGLEDADVVLEEIVEGGITRFLAIYDCGDNRRVGPVRSARVDDGSLARPFTRVLAYSGANRPVEKALAKSQMIRRTELDSPAFHRVPPGSADIHSLTLDTKQLRRTLKSTKARAPRGTIFERGKRRRGKRVRVVRINFTSSNTIEYRWRGGLWRRYEAGEAFRTRSGGSISIPNLVVQRVEVDRSQKIVDAAGNPSPDIKLAGRGKALLFRDGTMMRGSWVRQRLDRPPRFLLSTGRPMPLDVGPVWVELLPSRMGEVKGSLDFR
jgi:Protein of unknown function (DUF3048) N-terminal domain/Protein of unknown function (DUF3048) C-terminal domain